MVGMTKAVRSVGEALNAPSIMRSMRICMAVS
jgi:hypothetical protein